MSFAFFVMITLQLTLDLPFEAGRLPRFFVLYCLLIVGVLLKLFDLGTKSIIRCPRKDFGGVGRDVFWKWSFLIDILQESVIKFYEILQISSKNDSKCLTTVEGKCIIYII